MFKIGLYAGSFNPVHLGHVMNIVKAHTLCEKLYIVLSYNEHEQINHKERFMWLKDITKDMKNVVVLKVFDQSHSKEEYNWDQGCLDIKKIVNEKIDVIFCGGDYRNNKIFQRLWSDISIHYFERNIMKISSTQIREDPIKYYDYLPQIVKPYYNKKVVVVGTESCGKSSLVKHLAKIYNTNYVEETGRDICLKAGGIDNMQSKHYYEILLKHLDNINRQIKTSNKILFIDTESLITLYYYNLSFMKTSEYDNKIKNLAVILSKTMKYDLWIFLEPDVTWVQDGTRTYGNQKMRLENNKTLKTLLKKMGIKYYVVGGTYNDRLENSIELINKYILSGGQK